LAVVEAWRAQDWDVILMDVQMPVVDGFTATRRIRALEAEARRQPTPIIALTANAMDHHQVECLAAGMNALVPKPLDIRRLAAAMEAAVFGQADADPIPERALAAG
ncbi:MAG: response regulator, partial [Brevundimonas sp.]